MNTWRNLPGKARVSIASLDPLLMRRARTASSCLTPGERELFLGMKRYDLAHSLAVGARLRDDPMLYRTALLHDAGKLPSELGLVYRWIYTWIEIFMPAVLVRIGERLEAVAEGDGALQRARSLPGRWRRGLYIQLHHGEIAADILRGLGSDRELIMLVEKHQGEPRDVLSRRFSEVDDAL